MSTQHRYNHQTPTMQSENQIGTIKNKLEKILPEIEIAMHLPLIEEILWLKKQKNAVILAHSYQLPEIYHGVADFVGDSLGLAQKATQIEADIIIQCGVHFMAETSKILNFDKKVLIPDLRAGCSLASSINANDVKMLKQKYPGTPIVTYINTSAEVKAYSDICCTSANAKHIVETLPGKQIICIPDEFLAKNIAREVPQKEIITWNGRCEVHEKFTAKEIQQIKKNHPGVIVLAHPECSPEVVVEADFSGSTSKMSSWVRQNQPEKVALITECSMSDNISVDNPDVDFIRPCNICPHMKRITLKNIKECLEQEKFEVKVDADIAKKAAVAVQKMIEFTTW